MKVKLVNLGIVMLIVFISFSIASGASQSKDNIISDEEFRDYQSMSLEEIQSFLESQNSFLASYKTKEGEMIYNAVWNYKINPKVIITT